MNTYLKGVLSAWYVAVLLVWVRFATSLFPWQAWLLPRPKSSRHVVMDDRAVEWLFPAEQEHFGVWFGPNIRRETMAAKSRQLWMYRVFMSRYVNAAQWEQVLRGVEPTQLPGGVMMDPRLPEYLAVQLVDLPHHWCRFDGAEDFIDRADVRAAATPCMWRYLLTSAPSSVALRAANCLSSFTDEDVRVVLARRDKGWVVACLLMTHEQVFTQDQWDLLLADFRSSWEVVRDPRLSESVIARYATSTFPGVLRAITDNERFSESLRIQTSLSMTPVSLQ